MTRPSNRTSAPKHRGPRRPVGAASAQRPASPGGKHAAVRPQLELGRRIRHNALLPGVTMLTLGAAAMGGVLNTDNDETATAALLAEVNSDPAPGSVDSAVLDELRTEREVSTSRSDRRTDVDSAKLEALSQETESGGQVTRTEDLGGGDPRQIAQALLPEFGFSSDQFSCLDSLWTKESGWNPAADNPTSSAYGIPQALPGEKMASAGADWATNPATQIRWGLGYIADVYGSPCSAWAHSQANNWY
jgi:hypothetical protein